MKSKTEIEEMCEEQKTELIIQLQNTIQLTQGALNHHQALLRLHRLWLKNREKSYPQNCCGQQIEGIDLDLLHQTIDGCVTVFLTREELTQVQKDYLYSSNDDLAFVTHRMTGYEGFYFRQLKKVVEGIIEQVTGISEKKFAD